jgi:hypothetical protein
MDKVSIFNFAGIITISVSALGFFIATGSQPVKMNIYTMWRAL